MHTVRAGDAEIAYDDKGDGDPLLLIPGLGADSRMWMLQIPAFSHRYRCIALDNRGVGSTVAPAGPYSMEQMASDALAVLDAAGVARAHVLGISMGGAIAQHLALKAPERVASLVLAATWCARNGYTERLAAVGRAVASLGHETLTRASMLWLFSPKLFVEQPFLVRQIEQLALEFTAGPGPFEDQLSAVLEHDVADRLAAVTAPTLVLAARRDIMVPPELSEQIAATIPGARLQVLDGGHAFNIESLEAFNAAVLSFLDEQ